MSKWVKKEDRVVVLSGNEKGRVGTVLMRSKDKVVVQGINMRKKHMKRTQQTQSAQIIDMEMPLHISNVSLCTEEGKPIRVKVKLGKDGSRNLIYLKDGKEVILRTIKKTMKRNDV